MTRDPTQSLRTLARVLAKGTVPFPALARWHALDVARLPALPVGPPPSPNRERHPYSGSLIYQGMPILVEQRQGETRSGVAKDGTPWTVTMRAHYGEFADTEGTDGDPIDVYVGPVPDAPYAYVVHQKVPGTEVHDEDKVILGVNTAAEAETLYRAQYDRPGFWGGCTRWPVAELRAAIKQRKYQRKRLDTPARVLERLEKALAHGLLALERCGCGDLLTQASQPRGPLVADDAARARLLDALQGVLVSGVTQRALQAPLTMTDDDVVVGLPLYERLLLAAHAVALLRGYLDEAKALGDVLRDGERQSYALAKAQELGLLPGPDGRARVMEKVSGHQLGLFQGASSAPGSATPAALAIHPKVADALTQSADLRERVAHQMREAGASDAQIAHRVARNHEDLGRYVEDHQNPSDGDLEALDYMLSVAQRSHDTVASDLLQTAVDQVRRPAEPTGQALWARERLHVAVGGAEEALSDAHKPSHFDAVRLRVVALERKHTEHVRRHGDEAPEVVHRLDALRAAIPAHEAEQELLQRHVAPHLAVEQARFVARAGTNNEVARAAHHANRARAQRALADAENAFAARAVRPTGGGWEAVPHGKLGGYRKRRADGGYDYWYRQGQPLLLLNPALSKAAAGHLARTMLQALDEAFPLAPDGYRHDRACLAMNTLGGAAFEPGGPSLGCPGCYLRFEASPKHARSLLDPRAFEAYQVMRAERHRGHQVRGGGQLTKSAASCLAQVLLTGATIGQVTKASPQ